MTNNKQIEKIMSEVPEIQECLQKVRDDIDKKYAHYLHKDPITNACPMCPNINDYLWDVEAIIKKLEIKLKHEYHLWIKQRGETKINTRSTTLDSGLLDFLEIKAYKTGIHEDIEKKLDKHFFTDYVPLSTAENWKKCKVRENWEK